MLEHEGQSILPVCRMSSKQTAVYAHWASMSKKAPGATTGEASAMYLQKLEKPDLWKLRRPINRQPAESTPEASNGLSKDCHCAADAQRRYVGRQPGFVMAKVSSWPRKCYMRL